MMTDDNVQHGIDDDPNNDATKGAALGGLGGAAVGAAAGSMAGPVGTVVGAVVGGLAGAGGSGAAVAAVDQVDNDNTVTGIGDGATTDANTTAHNVARRPDADVNVGNDVRGVQTGGYTTTGQDTRGITEKTADVITGDKTDDKTGGRVVDS